MTRAFPVSPAVVARGTRQGSLSRTASRGQPDDVSLLAGTPWELPVRGAIAIIEEVGERPYEIDFGSHPARAHRRFLAQLAAVVVGDLTRCTDANPPTGVPDPADAALQTVLQRLHAAGNTGRGRRADWSWHTQAVPSRCRRDSSRCWNVELSPVVD